MEVTEIIWGSEKRREGPHSQRQLPLVLALKVLSLVRWGGKTLHKASKCKAD